MNSYSIQFIAKLQKGKGRTWALSQCSDMVKVLKRLRSLRQLVTVIAGPSSDILTELSDFENILENCSPTWRRSINIRQLRAYTFFINLPTRTVYITTKEQGGQKIFPPIGVKEGNSDAYAAVILFMDIFIRVLEGNNSLNIQWINDMAVGKTQPCQDWGDNTEIESIFNIFANLQQPQASPKITSHPSEITIYASPTSYEIIIIKH
jgi:hypothetical protein